MASTLSTERYDIRDKGAVLKPLHLLVSGIMALLIASVCSDTDGSDSPRKTPSAAARASASDLPDYIHERFSPLLADHRSEP